MKPEFIKAVAKIQREINAPKNQFNKFGNYAYRSCEDILQAIKPLLGDMVLTVNDEIVLVGERFYIKSTATITDGVNSLSNSALAREAQDKKGMDDAQITGSASSYARKYCLNGLFCIDDTKDSDATNDHGKKLEPKKEIKPVIEAIDYKMQANQIDRIVISLGQITNGQSTQQKGEAMVKFCGVRSFEEMKRMNNKQLAMIIDKINEAQAGNARQKREGDLKPKTAAGAKFRLE